MKKRYWIVGIVFVLLAIFLYAYNWVCEFLTVAIFFGIVAVATILTLSLGGFVMPSFGHNKNGKK